MTEEIKVLSPVVQIVKDVEHGRVLILKEPWSFKTGKGVQYVVPEGFISDGASVPRFFWRLLSPCIDPITLGPSIEHDWRYENHIGTRAECDADYKDRLIENGYPRWKAYLTLLGVRIGGKSHY